MISTSPAIFSLAFFFFRLPGCLGVCICVRMLVLCIYERSQFFSSIWLCTQMRDAYEPANLCEMDGYRSILQHLFAYISAAEVIIIIVRVACYLGQIIPFPLAYAIVKY